MHQIAEAISLVVSNIESEEAIAKAKATTLQICEKFPLPYEM